jgi:hypothetical protein
MPPKGARIFCDQGVSFALVAKLREITSFEYSYSYAYHEGVADIPDGELLTYADRQGYAVMLTTDQNIRHQQNMRGRKIGLVVLGTTDTDTLVANVMTIAQAIQSITTPGKIAVVPLTTPKRTTRNTTRH